MEKLKRTIYAKIKDIMQIAMSMKKIIHLGVLLEFKKNFKVVKNSLE